MVGNADDVRVHLQLPACLQFSSSPYLPHLFPFLYFPFLPDTRRHKRLSSWRHFLFFLSSIPNCQIIETGWDKGNWTVMLEKITDSRLAPGLSQIGPEHPSPVLHVRV